MCRGPCLCFLLRLACCAQETQRLGPSTAGPPSPEAARLPLTLARPHAHTHTPPCAPLCLHTHTCERGPRAVGPLHPAHIHTRMSAPQRSAARFSSQNPCTRACPHRGRLQEVTGGSEVGAGSRSHGGAGGGEGEGGVRAAWCGRGRPCPWLHAHPQHRADVGVSHTVPARVRTCVCICICVCMRACYVRVFCARVSVYARVPGCMHVTVYACTLHACVMLVPVGA